MKIEKECSSIIFTVWKYPKHCFYFKVFLSIFNSTKIQHKMAKTSKIQIGEEMAKDANEMADQDSVV